MKITIDINGVPTEINLTEDQIKDVQQVKPAFNWRDIKSWEDVLKAKLSIVNPVFHACHDNMRKRLNAHFKLANLIELINEGWTPDWTNSNQQKWRIYTYWEASKNGFSSVVYSYVSRCGVGSDLHIETKEKAEHMLKYFEKEFLELLT